MISGKKLLVFVSSTYTDLIEERQAAVEAILKAGHIPAGMELFTAGNKSQLQAIYNWIDQCDVYMLILGGRYGSLEPESLVSYTELEYNYTANRGMPIFSVVANESAIDTKVKLHGAKVIETQNKRQYDQFKDKVLERISAFYSDTKDIKLAVHESLGDYRVDASLPGWISGRELPDIASLTDELDRLRSENAELERRIGSIRPDNEADQDFSQLRSLLIGTEIKVPQKLIENAVSEQNMSVLELFLSVRDTLITGVTNRYNANEYETFIYFSLIPKLQVYDLAENEKVTGVAYRRSYLTKKGRRFLAWLDQRAAINRSA